VPGFPERVSPLQFSGHSSDAVLGPIGIIDSGGGQRDRSAKAHQSKRHHYESHGDQAFDVPDFNLVFRTNDADTEYLEDRLARLPSAIKVQRGALFTREAMPTVNGLNLLMKGLENGCL
jgi:hypothetical protein